MKHDQHDHTGGSVGSGQRTNHGPAEHRDRRAAPIPVGTTGPPLEQSSSPQLGKPASRLVASTRPGPITLTSAVAGPTALVVGPRAAEPTRSRQPASRLPPQRRRSHVSSGQEVLLLELGAQGARTQGQLAPSSGCEPPTVTVSVRKLEAAGLVLRRTSSTDERVTIVELSDQGRELLPRLHAVWQQLADETIAAIPRSNPHVLRETLTDLASSLNNAASS